MAKPTSELKQALQRLGIHQKFELKAPALAFKSPTHLEHTQNERPRKEQAPTEPAQADPEIPPQSGFFRLAHACFQDPVLRALTGEEFRVFLWLSTRAWQFADSIGQVRASVGFIRAGLGCSPASITRALRSLQDQDLLQLVRQDFKRGNLWQVAPRAVDRGGTPGGAKKGQVSQNELAHMERAPSEGARNKVPSPSNRAASSISLSDQPTQVEREARTQEPIQDAQARRERGSRVDAYFARFLPTRLRVREEQAYVELRQTHSAERIDQALEWVLKHGAPGSGDRVHSPLQFLAVGIASVPLPTTSRSVVAAQGDGESGALDRELENAGVAFRLAHPTREAEQAVIAAYQERTPGLAIAGRIGRELAVLDWWKTRGIARG